MLASEVEFPLVPVVLVSGTTGLTGVFSSGMSGLRIPKGVFLPVIPAGPNGTALAVAAVALSFTFKKILLNACYPDFVSALTKKPKSAAVSKLIYTLFSFIKKCFLYSFVSAPLLSSGTSVYLSMGQSSSAELTNSDSISLVCLALPTSREIVIEVGEFCLTYSSPHMLMDISRAETIFPFVTAAR